MRKKTLASITLAVTLVLSFSAIAAESTAPRKTLKAFASEEELAELFKGWAAEHKRRDEARRAQSIGGVQAYQSAPAPASTKTRRSPSGRRRQPGLDRCALGD